MEEQVAICFTHVKKTYKLYKSAKKRFLGLIFGERIPYKKYNALDDVSFTINKGEAVGLVGRNGAGKSTLLKLITGVTFAEEGEITVNGQVAALLELESGFDPQMSGRENIYLKGYILGLTPEAIEAVEDDIVEFADIGDFIDQPVGKYSSGMRARLGFAINVEIRPEILVIDEALAVGDAAFSEKCRNKVRSLIDSGVTVLFVSHAKDQMMEFCDRALFMDKGKILADGPAEEITRQYDAFVEQEKKREREERERRKREGTPERKHRKASF